MISEHKIEKWKMYEPLKKSIWYYTFLIISSTAIWLLIDELIPLLIAYSFFILPVFFHIILHLQYYHHDKNINLTIDYGNKHIRYTKDSLNKEISFDDIKEIQRIKGSKYPKVFETYTIPSIFYHWTKIITKSGETISFTDFVKPDINIVGIKKTEKVVPFLNLII